MIKNEKKYGTAIEFLSSLQVCERSFLPCKFSAKAFHALIRRQVFLFQHHQGNQPPRDLQVFVPWIYCPPISGALNCKYFYTSRSL